MYISVLNYRFSNVLGNLLRKIALFVLLVVFSFTALNAETVDVPGGGKLTVSPSKIVNEGIVRYSYTPGAQFPNSYPSWERLTYQGGTLYYTQGYRQGDPFFYFFRPVRWGTFSFSPNRERCPRAPEGSSTEVILEFARRCDEMIGCNARDHFCELKVRANRREGEDWRGYFWPNCRADYYLGPFPDTSGGGSQATSRINLFLRDAYEGFDPQVDNPLTLTSTGPLPDCPDPDPFVPEEPVLEFNCDNENGDLAEVNIEINPDVSGRVDMYADIYSVCEFYGEEFDFGESNNPDCDPEFESCDDPVEACVEQSSIDWYFGDGNTQQFTSAYDTIFHDYEEAGDYQVNVTVQPFGVTTQCQLKLKPPEARVDVQPIGTKLVTTPDGSLKRRATVGSAFEMKVVVRTTEGFGKVKSLHFEDADLLTIDSDNFNILEKPTLPGVPVDVEDDTLFFSGIYVVEAVGEGEASFAAQVNYQSLGEQKQHRDSELVQAGGGLVVNVYANSTVELSQTNFDRNVFSVRVEVENSGSEQLQNVTLEHGNLVLMNVPGTGGNLGRAQSLKSLAPSIPSTLDAGEKHEAIALLQATDIGAVRIAAIVTASDEEGNYYEIGKGADVNIIEDGDGFVDEKSFWRELEGLVIEYLATAQAGAEELEARGAAMIDHMMKTAQAGGDLEAAGRALEESCSVPAALFPAGKPASEVREEQGLFAKKLNEKAYIPDFIKSAFSEEERAKNPAKELVAAQLLARIIASEEATTEFVQEKTDEIGGIGTALGYLSVGHNREMLANKVVGAIKDFDQANEEGLAIMYNAFVNDDQSANDLIESAFVDLADRQEAAVEAECKKIANNTKENLELLAEGKYAEFQFKNDKRTKKASLEFLVDALGGLGSQKLLSEGAERLSKSAVGEFTKQAVDNSKTHLRQSVSRVNRKLKSYRGKADDEFFEGGAGAQNAARNRRVRADKSAPDDPPVTVRNGAIVGAADEFPGYVGGLSPDEQAALKDIAGLLDNERIKYANSLPEGPTKQRLLSENIEVQLTPTNPFSSPEWRRRKGLLPVTPKQETMKAKSISLDDIALGVPEKYLGQVAIYNPEKAYRAMSKADQVRYRQRYLSQKETWKKYNTADSSLRKNIDRATKPGGDTFIEDAPSHKGNRFRRDREGNRIPNSDQNTPVTREITEHWKEQVEDVDAVGGPVISFEDLSVELPGGGHPVIGGDMDGQMIGFLSGEKIPGPLQSKLRSVFRAEARKRGSDPSGKRSVLNGDLRFADHGFTKVGADWLAKFDDKRIEYLVERVPEKKGRELFKKWIDIQNDIIRKNNPNLPEEQLAALLKDFDKEAELLDFGTKLTSITRNNVRVVDGESATVEAVIQRNAKRLSPK